MSTAKKLLSGWGNYPRETCTVHRPERYHQLQVPEGSVIARGLGRSYGDASLNKEGSVILMERLNRFLTFDPEKGIVQAEAGVSLEEILQVFVPRGWFLPVTPGTKFATLGGCIACDVHGKNHHADGSFGRYVKKMEILTADGSMQRCAPDLNPSLFWSSVGGMGLTGIITQAAVQLLPIPSAYITLRQYAPDSLEGVFRILDDKEREEKYSVAWIDCLSKGKQMGRGIVGLGRHAAAEEVPAKQSPYAIPRKKPSSAASLVPSWMLNRWSIALFNDMYYALQSRHKEHSLVDYDTYFYPLDRIQDWNKLYGKKGFTQYQFVVPLQQGYEAIKTVLSLMATEGWGSYLAVLKRFGKEGSGLLSFPFEGYTLAMDIPIRNESLLPFLNRLDEIVLRYAGRVYLAKDCRLNPAHFRSMYPRYPEWAAAKNQIDPSNTFSSDLARRLHMGGTA